MIHTKYTHRDTWTSKAHKCVLYTHMDRLLAGTQHSLGAHTPAKHLECTARQKSGVHSLFIAYASHNFSGVVSPPGCAGTSFSGLFFSVHSSKTLSRSWACLSFDQSGFTIKNFRRHCFCENLVWVAKVSTHTSAKAESNYTYTYWLLIIFLSVADMRGIKEKPAVKGLFWLIY